MTKITLSFDNGPDPDVTPQVLETLGRHGIKASFFVVGNRLRDRRTLAERAHAEGHWIGNHTYNHMVPLGRSKETGVAVEEIVRTEALIGDLAHARRFFRPFGGGGNLNDGLLNREALDHLRAQHYSCVLWNVVPEDWAYPSGWVERALNQCEAEDHALMVLHDLPTGAMDHLDRFLSEAQKRGASFTQDFPATCIPIACGEVVSPIDEFVSGLSN